MLIRSSPIAATDKPTRLAYEQATISGPGGRRRTVHPEWLSAGEITLLWASTDKD